MGGKSKASSTQGPKSKAAGAKASASQPSDANVLDSTVAGTRRPDRRNLDEKVDRFISARCKHMSKATVEHKVM